MTRTELKTLKPGDIVYDKKSGEAYEFLKICKFHTYLNVIVYNLHLKICSSGEDIFISSKRICKELDIRKVQ